MTGWDVACVASYATMGMAIATVAAMIGAGIEGVRLAQMRVAVVILVLLVGTCSTRTPVCERADAEAKP